MSGVASSPAPQRSRPARDEDKELFSHLVVSNPPLARAWFGFRTSLAIHALILALVILVPVLWPTPLPETTTDYVRALLYDPPPPPPPPLPKGSALVPKTQPAKPVTEDWVKPETPKFTAPVEVPKKEEPLKPEDKAPASEQQGSETGSEYGVLEGMEVGVEGGMVGGVPGGVLGGVLGGTGTGPVLDYDQPPRPIKITRPTYPQEAFIKKIEGTVVLEILIDSTGRVVWARVIQSVPLLDAAAVQTVYQWVFAPAIKRGRPVPTLAQAPVSFRIF